MSLTFTTESSHITCNGFIFNIRGVNWFGFETEVRVVHGLWARKMSDILNWIQSKGFNAIRIPFAADLALSGLDQPLPNGSGNGPAVDFMLNPQLKDKTAGQILHMVIEEAGKRGLLVMLDMHRLYGNGIITPLWYDNKTSESDVIKAWINMVTRYNQWNVFAADIKNEPYGNVTWGDNNPATDFALFAEKAGNAILKVNPKLLIFVEGIDRFVDGSNTVWGCWGGCLQAVAKRPIKLSIPAQIVYSPHQYGPGVAGPGCATADKWQANFGFIKDKNLGALCVGEWGGEVNDNAWQDAFSKWLAAKGINNSFYWCLNPNSGDTGGILGNDWKTERPEKIGFINTVTPNPTKITVKADGSVSIPNGIKPHTSPVNPPVNPPAPPVNPPAPPVNPPVNPPTPPVNPPTPPVNPPSVNGITVSVKTVNSWVAHDKFSQIAISLTNNTGKPVSAITLSKPALDSFWNMNDNRDNTFTTPVWVAPLAVGASFTFGAIVKGNIPTFSVVKVV